MDHDFDRPKAFQTPQMSQGISIRAPTRSYNDPLPVDPPEYVLHESSSIASIGNDQNLPISATSYPGMSVTSLRPTQQRMTASSGRRKDIDRIEELTDLTYVLTPVGQILYASGAVTDLFGYMTEEVVGHNVMEFIHADDVERYVHAFNDAITNRTRLLHYHRFRQKDGSFIILETMGHAIYDEFELAADLNGNQVPTCKCFVSSARCYPSRATAALDNYFEMKLENEAMKAELRGYADLDTGSSRGESSTAKTTDTSMESVPGLLTDFGDEDPLLQPPCVSSSIAASANNFRVPTVSNPIPPRFLHSYSYPQYTSISPITYRSQNPIDPVVLEIETPKELTHEFKHSDKPRRHSTERKTSSPLISKSRSPGKPYKLKAEGLGEVVLGDASARKKIKKPRVDMEEHVCTDCGTTDSPEWRKGINGPKTLCNACGLRYSKRQKKAEGVDSSGHDPIAAPDDISGHPGQHSARAPVLRRSSSSISSTANRLTPLSRTAVPTYAELGPVPDDFSSAAEDVSRTSPQNSRKHRPKQAKDEMANQTPGFMAPWQNLG